MSILPKSSTEDRFQTLKALFTQSYSPQAINAIFDSLGLSYSQKEIDELKEEYLKEYEAWAQKELPSDCIGIFKNTIWQAASSSP